MGQWVDRTLKVHDRIQQSSLPLRVQNKTDLVLIERLLVLIERLPLLLDALGNVGMANHGDALSQMVCRNGRHLDLQILAQDAS